MKYVIALVASMMFSVTANAACKYVYVNGKAHYVCDNGSSSNSSSNCRYVYIDGQAHYVCG